MLFRFACTSCGNEAILRILPGYEVPEEVPYRCGHTLTGTAEDGVASIFVCPGETLHRVLTPHPLVDLGSYPALEENE